MNDKKISQNRVKKEGIVAELSDKKGKAKALIFTNYQGLTHKQIEDLKKGIKAADAEFVVAKNSLLQKAMADIKDIESLKGPTGTIFAYSDVVAPLKQVAKTLKQFNLPTIKFGILEGVAYDSEQVLKISTLPTREVLIAQFVGGMKAPLYALHRSLNWNLQKLVATLSEISKKKSVSVPVSEVTAPVAKVAAVVEEVSAPEVTAPTAEETPAEEEKQEEQIVEEVKV